MKNIITIMLFELFITIHVKIQLLPKDILLCYNSKFENNHIIRDADAQYCYFKLANNTQKMLQT